MRRLALLVAAAALLGAGCAGGGGDPPAEQRPAAAERSAFPRSPAVLERRDGTSVRITVEIARTEEQRARGLMHRSSLEPDHGMLFVFPAPTGSGFWMKNTLVPLSIAFMDGEGRIRRILDMEPCRADPCRIYRPGVTYRRALEVERGAFGRWNVGVGDRFRLTG